MRQPIYCVANRAFFSVPSLHIPDGSNLAGDSSINNVINLEIILTNLQQTYSRLTADLPNKHAQHLKSLYVTSYLLFSETH